MDTTTTYVGDRRVLDADSHVMELADFLDEFIDPEFKDQLRDVTGDRLAGVLADAVAKSDARHSDADKAKLAEERLLEDKGWHAMGAFDPTERSRVLDLFGFEGQLVFATFATARFAGKDEDRLYAGSSAQNQAVSNFCSQDTRLFPVAYVPLVDPDRAARLAVEAIDTGCSAVMVPSTAAGTRSPTHPDLDGFWDVLSEAGVPFVLHVGGGGRLLDPTFHNNAMPVSDHLGGGENVRSKDYLAIPHSPQVFLGTLIYDGLFDRFPKLRGGCIEQGAGWVVSWMRHLDYGVRAFRRTEEPLRRLELTPSDYVRRNLKFTPFPGEPVDWMIEQTGSELFMFSTDYPHPEGGKDPLQKFDDALAGSSDEVRSKFFYDNMNELLHGARVA
jgi:predicted TIM-barrel fold metal-dependent hydrolase